MKRSKALILILLLVCIEMMETKDMEKDAVVGETKRTKRGGWGAPPPVWIREPVPVRPDPQIVYVVVQPKPSLYYGAYSGATYGAYGGGPSVYSAYGNGAPGFSYYGRR